MRAGRAPRTPRRAASARIVRAILRAEDRSAATDVGLPTAPRVGSSACTMDVAIVEQSESITLLALTGRLDTAGVDRVEARVNAALQRHGHGVLDLSQVTFLSSLGTRMLISAAKLLSRRGSRLVLVAPRALVDQAIR